MAFPIYTLNWSRYLSKPLLFSWRSLKIEVTVVKHPFYRELHCFICEKVKPLDFRGEILNELVESS